MTTVYVVLSSAVVIALSFTVVLGTTGKCPPAADIAPCTCNATQGVQVNCTRVNNTVWSIVKKLDMPLRSLFISEYNGTGIPDKAFEGVNTTWLTVTRSPRLKNVSKNAFTGIVRVLHLDLSMNNITKLPNHAFSSLDNLQTLTLSFNNLTNLTAATMAGMKNLTAFYATFANVEYLETGAFKEQAQLRVLDLSRNKLDRICTYQVSSGGKTKMNLGVFRLYGNNIKMLEDKAFADLSLLTELDLGSNNLTNVSADSLAGLTNLEKLLLDHNNIRAIENKSFRDLHKLEYLEFAFNHVQNLSSSFLGNLYNLKVLRFSHNNISTVADRTFENTPALRQLDISSNLIANVSACTFEGLISLTDLDLSYNNLGRNISNDTFTSLKRLERLRMELSNITFLYEGTLDPLGFLRFLHLSMNNLRNISNSSTIFAKLKRLELLEMKWCNLSEIPPSVGNLSSIIELNLSMNNITVINQRTFAKTKNLTDLVLTRNNITFIAEGAFNNISLRSLNLAQNNLTAILNWFINVSLVDLDLSFNRISNLSSALHSLQTLRILNMEGNALYIIRKNKDGSFWPDSLKYLNLANNRICDLEEYSFGEILLESLKLNGNNLTFVRPNVFLLPRHVNLSSNNISEIHSNAFGFKVGVQLDLRCKLHDYYAKT